MAAGGLDHELGEEPSFYAWLPEPTPEELAWLAKLRRRVRRPPIA